MDEQKGLLLEIAEAIVRHLRRRVPQADSAPSEQYRPRWLGWVGRQLVPNVGTLLLVVVLLLTVPSLAAPLYAPEATSTSTISYQGRLADSSGNPLTDKCTMEFRIFDVPVGGVPLWTEMWTGGNAVDVSDGLFNVMLGSINNTLASAIEGYDELYLGITVGTDSEMEPRVQLGSVPFSMQAMSVSDGSITTAKIQDGQVGNVDLANNAVTAAKIKDQEITDAELANPRTTQWIHLCFTPYPSCPGVVSDFSSVTLGSNKIWSGSFSFTPFSLEVLEFVGGRIELAEDGGPALGYVPVAIWAESANTARFSAILPDRYFNTVNSRLYVTVVGR